MSHEQLSDNEIVHKTYVAGGLERTTVSYLDAPLTADEQVLAMLGTNAHQILVAARHQRILDHNAIVDRYEDEIDGVQPERARSFVAEELGDVQKDLKYLNDGDFNWVVQATKRNYIQPVDDIAGVYLLDADIAISRRNEDLEQLNPGQAEANAVHELAHAFGAPRWVMDQRGHLRLEIGFGLGSALEEGWACYYGGRYAERVLGRGRRARIRGSSLDTRLEKHRVWSRSGDGEKDGLTKSVGTRGAYAAVILEQVIEQDPQILTIMQGSRFDQTKLEELQLSFDNIHPELYEQLRTIRVYEDSDARRKLIQLYTEIDPRNTPLPRRIAANIARKIASPLLSRMS